APWRDARVTQAQRKLLSVPVVACVKGDPRKYEPTGLPMRSFSSCLHEMIGRMLIVHSVDLTGHTVGQTEEIVRMHEVRLELNRPMPSRDPLIDQARPQIYITQPRVWFGDLWIQLQSALQMSERFFQIVRISPADRAKGIGSPEP